MHLVTGLTVAVVVVFLAVTGSVMALGPQMTRWAERGVRAEAAGPACVLPSTLLEGAAAAAGRFGMAGRPGSLAVFHPAGPEAGRPAEVGFGGDGAVLLVDGCTGRVLGAGSRVRVLLHGVTELHHQMAWGGMRHERLNGVKNAAVLLFVFLLGSGLWIWTPRVWTGVALRKRAVPEFGLPGRAREWNWHSVAGIWVAVPLLVISLTGVVMAFPWANALLYRAAGEQPPAPRREAAGREATGHEGEKHRGGRMGGEAAGAFAGVDAAVARGEGFRADWTGVTVRLGGGRPGAGGGAALPVTVSHGTGGAAVLRDQLQVLPDGTVLKAEPFAGLSRGRRWRMYVRWGHTGELGGLAGQVVVLVSVLGALVLAGTGVSLSVRRWAAWRARRRRGVEARARGTVVG